jgi:hypothetical protein
MQRGHHLYTSACEPKVLRSLRARRPMSVKATDSLEFNDSPMKLMQANYRAG